MPSASDGPSVGTGTPSESSPEITPPALKFTQYPLIPRSNLIIKEQLGAGSYGSVFRGVWSPNKNGLTSPAPSPTPTPSLTVALKKVFMLEKEVDILSQIRHKNIIQFFGVSHAHPDFFIVTEYAENGSLYDYLHSPNADQLSSNKILKWASQIANGVAYLHYDAPVTIIHRDLKSKNVVIGAKMTCKLCDFGTSKDLTHSWTAPTWGGTAAWMSPEIISQSEAGITTATDVWSFGVLLWELFTREVPYKGLTEFKIYSIISQQGVKLVIPDSCPAHLTDLLKNCWQTNPKERIDMKEIVACLARMKGSSDVQQQCAHFVEAKDEWGCKIKEQLDELDNMKLDLARQIEELNRREQALRKRESSHRNFLNMVDYVGFDNVSEWTEDCVTEWIQKIAADAGDLVSEEMVDRIIAIVLQYEIKGCRLLQVTEQDLANLGIDSAKVRRYITQRISELRLKSEESCAVQEAELQFPTLQTANALDAMKKQEKAKAPCSTSIVLHVGLYTREMPNGGSGSGSNSDSTTTRFKVFLDSDWEERIISDSIPPEIYDSATVIKDVCFSIVAADKTVLLDTVRCMCPPFGYLEWVDLPTGDNKMPITITCSVSYTDQIIQPRNKRIDLEVDSISSGARTLCQKSVPLKIRPVATCTSLKRITSSHFNNSVSAQLEHAASTSKLQGVWRGRANSFGSSTSTTSLGAIRKGSASVAWNGFPLAGGGGGDGGGFTSPPQPLHQQPPRWVDHLTSGNNTPTTPPMPIGSPPRHSGSFAAATSPRQTYPILQTSISTASTNSHSNHHPSPLIIPARGMPPPPTTMVRKPTPTRSPLYNQLPHASPTTLNSHYQPPQLRTFMKKPLVNRRSENDFNSSLTSDEGRANFFMDEEQEPESPSTSDTKGGSGGGGSPSPCPSEPAVEEVVAKELPNRCCANSCRSRPNAHRLPSNLNMNEEEDNNEENGVTRSQRRRRSKRILTNVPEAGGAIENGKASMPVGVIGKGAAATATVDDLVVDQLKDTSLLGKCSTKVYGGRDKWRWGKN